MKEQDGKKMLPPLEVYVERERVWIKRGVQSFMLAYDGEGGELDWYADRLRGALAGRETIGETIPPVGDATARNDSAGVPGMVTTPSAHAAEALRLSALGVAAPSADKLLGDLLARIHRDGGHYVMEHGWKKAAEDAEAKVVAWLARDDAGVMGTGSAAGHSTSEFSNLSNQAHGYGVEAAVIPELDMEGNPFPSGVAVDAQPVGYVPRCHADGPDCIVGEIRWDEVSEKSFEVAHPENWHCLALYATPGAAMPAEPQWGPILDALDSWPNDCRDDDFKHLERLIRAEHARTLDRLDAARNAGVAPSRVPPGWKIERRDSKPFKVLNITAPNGYSSSVGSHERNPMNVLYMLAEALLAAGVKASDGQIDWGAVDEELNVILDRYLPGPPPMTSLTSELRALLRKVSGQ